jgi:hypothetical protein
MNKKSAVIACVFLVVFVAGNAFAEELLQCRDPSDGTIRITFAGDSVAATYSGKSAQEFEVVVVLKNETTQYLTFSFPRTTNPQTRRQNKRANGPIERIVDCSLATSY